ncbi:MAG: hypothetical protein U0401_00805 [Anaerolineae bacterium]
MQVLSRRSFIKVLSGLVAFVPAAKILAAPEGVQSTDPSLEIENYAGGKALKVDSDKIVIDMFERGDVTLYISPKTIIWKGDWNGGLPIEVGDYINAWGGPRDKQSLDVEKMWVNIINLRGTASDLKNEANSLRLRLSDSSLGEYSIEINQKTLISCF